MAATRAPLAGTGEPLVSIVHVALLTAGYDKPYAVPLSAALAQHGVLVDFIGGDALHCREVTRTKGVTFLNLRGDQREDVAVARKAIRLLAYYARLVRYVAMAQPRILHILWNNKFELFDRTLLMLFYRVAGKRVVFTAHNVNAAKRDSCDGWTNRLSLRIQYHLCDHIFVHTEPMKHDLAAEFGVDEEKVSVIPHGINNLVPTTDLTPEEARRRLGMREGDKTTLFFGSIAPYKGLEYLISALTILAKADRQVRLIIAGRIKRGAVAYWARVQQAIADGGIRDQVMQRIEFIRDEDVECYFKAADVVVIPYADLSQSGVLVTAHHFGVPVIATDVGALREDVIDDRTGFLCPPRDPTALAKAIDRYFSSELYRHLPARREEIRRFANERHSWTTVAQITRSVYTRLSVGRPDARTVDPF
jgi:glycosyltransferase involved in cell wall biosynthesis